MKIRIIGCSGSGKTYLAKRRRRDEKRDSNLDERSEAKGLTENTPVCGKTSYAVIGFAFCKTSYAPLFCLFPKKVPFSGPPLCIERTVNTLTITLYGKNQQKEMLFFVALPHTVAFFDKFPHGKSYETTKKLKIH